MTQEPYRPARQVSWIMDNGSSHRGQACIDRITKHWPTVVPVHTPVHPSWLNQVEVYFSILERKALTPNDFSSLEALEKRLFDFARYYENLARIARLVLAHAEQVIERFGTVPRNHEMTDHICLFQSADSQRFVAGIVLNEQQRLALVHPLSLCRIHGRTNPSRGTAKHLPVRIPASHARAGASGGIPLPLKTCPGPSFAVAG